MKVVIDTNIIKKNIDTATRLTNRPISLMFKDFYSDIYLNIKGDIKNKIFGLNLPGSVCYSLGKATTLNKGAVVTSVADAYRVMDMRIKELYIPINANDGREGLSVYEAHKLATDILAVSPYDDIVLKGMITSGCINEEYPTLSELDTIWCSLKDCIEAISLGGSFWLGTNLTLPEYISDVRIGEYMLFGTIPYDNDIKKLGRNSIEMHTKVIGVYPDRNSLIVDCGYSMADMKDCHILGNLKYVDCSSEYTMLTASDISRYRIGDEVKFIPNYKSLVKLRYAEREFR